MSHGLRPPVGFDTWTYINSQWYSSILILLQALSCCRILCHVPKYVSNSDSIPVQEAKEIKSIGPLCLLLFLSTFISKCYQCYGTLEQQLVQIESIFFPVVACLFLFTSKYLYLLYSSQSVCTSIRYVLNHNIQNNKS